MDLHSHNSRPDADTYLVGRGPAWFAFAMTIGLMLFDYIDRQVVVSLFPHLKAEWNLSDTQLGALVSVVSITVGLAGIPIALIADRYSRVKSIVIMATAWSLASISCMFTRNFGQLLAARSMVGLGEAGYGSVGAALIASIFPARLRSTLLAAFFAAASVGSVLGVLLGGVIATHWGWKAAFGVVGFPGLVLALLYVKVRDYHTVPLTQKLTQVTSSTANVTRHVIRSLLRTPTLLWVCLGGASQLIVVSAIWAWLPSFLNRFHGVAPDQAGAKAALIVLCGAAGSVVWGTVIDRMGKRRARTKLISLAALCVAALLVLVPTFGATVTGDLSPSTQFALIAIGGFLMTCSVGPVAAVVMDVVHPGVRATGGSIVSLFQNLLGLAAGPLIAGAFSDAYGLETALTLTPLFGLAAAGFFLLAARSYEADIKRVADVHVEVETGQPVAVGRKAMA